MNVHIDDSAFIDLINDRLETEIAALESSVEDLESEMGDKTDEEYVDDLAVDLRNEWTADIDTMREQIENNIPSTSVDYEDEINDIQRELINNDQGCAVMARNVNTLMQQVAELELAFAALAQPQPGVIRRAYNRVLAMSSSINWYSPKL